MTCDESSAASHRERMGKSQEEDNGGSLLTESQAAVAVQDTSTGSGMRKERAAWVGSSHLALCFALMGQTQMGKDQGWNSEQGSCFFLPTGPCPCQSSNWRKTGRSLSSGFNGPSPIQSSKSEKIAAGTNGPSATQ